MKPLPALLLVCVAGLGWTNLSPGQGGSRAGHAVAPCPPGPHGIRKICCPEPAVQKVNKECWQVEHKEICIPPVRFPWQKNGPRQCGKVRVIRVLKKKQYQVEQCGWKWQPTTICDEKAPPRKHRWFWYAFFGKPAPHYPASQEENHPTCQ